MNRKRTATTATRRTARRKSAEARRIRLVGVPLSLGAGIRGADQGYGVVRSASLMDQLQRLGLHIEDDGLLPVPATPREAGDARARYLEEIASTCEGLARWVEGTLAAGDFPLVVGGDHSISIGTVAGVAAYARRRRGRIGLVWVDAHGDMNTPESTLSGNVHGMPLAVAVGLGSPRLVQLGGFAPKVRGANTALVGVRDLDPGEVDNIRASGLAAITMRDIDEFGMAACMERAIRAATRGTIGFHLSLDLDALDPTFAPGVGTPVIGGLSYREAHLAMEMAADSGALLSLDVVEINPLLDRKGATADAAIKLIASGLGKNILPTALSPMRRKAPSPRRS